MKNTMQQLLDRFEKNILQNEINVPKVLIQHEKQKKDKILILI